MASSWFGGRDLSGRRALLLLVGGLRLLGAALAAWSLVTHWSSLLLRLLAPREMLARQFVARVGGPARSAGRSSRPGLLLDAD
jgi:hypothetical protein